MFNVTPIKCVVRFWRRHPGRKAASTSRWPTAGMSAAACRSVWLKKIVGERNNQRRSFEVTPHDRKLYERRRALYMIRGRFRSVADSTEARAIEKRTTMSSRIRRSISLKSSTTSIAKFSKVSLTARAPAPPATINVCRRISPSVPSGKPVGFPLLQHHRK
jgi:hypothetical protein